MSSDPIEPPPFVADLRLHVLVPAMVRAANQETRMGKKKTKVVTSETAKTETTVVEVAASPELKPRHKKSKASDADVQVESPASVIDPEPPADLGPTLEDLVAGYIAHLEASGKSQGTVFSYRLELAVALQELGATTPVRELTAARIEAFFACDRVTKTRAGVLKARVSVEKTKRVLRQALARGAERGIVPSEAPSPIAST